MTYGTCSIRLSLELAQDKRALLGAQIRSLKGVVAASVGDKALTVWYKEALPLALVRRLVKRMEEECARRMIRSWTWRAIGARRSSRS